MKKAVTLILAFLYLVPSFGATFSMHFCMGEFVETSRGIKSDSVCGGCGMKKDKGVEDGCCKDECKFLQHAKHDVIAKQKFSFPKIELRTEIFISSIMGAISSLMESTAFQLYCSSSPPFKDTVALFVRNSVFRI